MAHPDAALPGEPTTRYDYEVDPAAENNTAAAIYRYVREGGQRVLDLGCGPAVIAAHLQKHAGKQVVCLDADAALLEAARARAIEQIVKADLEDPSWLDLVDGEPFDVIILADVLEHLVDPGAVLAGIRDRGLLRENGFLVISIPNAAHEAVVMSLLTGRFTYTDTGLLDRTHLRWFTRDSFTAFCEQHGYVVTRLDRTLRTLPQTQQRTLTSDIPTALREELARRPQLETRTYQFIARVEPMGAATELDRLRADLSAEQERAFTAIEKRESQLRELREQLEEHEQATAAQIEELKQRHGREQLRRDEVIAKLSADLTELHAESQREIEELRAELKEAVAERDQFRIADRVGTHPEFVEKRAAAELERLKRKLDMVYESETWRAGEVLLWLPKRLKRLGGR